MVSFSGLFRLHFVFRSWVIRAVPVLIALVFPPETVLALNFETVAGRINETPVTVAELDRAAGGVLRPTWRRILAMYARASRELCAERVEEVLAAADGLERDAWRARIWLASKPSADAVREAAGGAHVAADDATLRTLAYRLQVERYRQALETRTNRVLTHDLLLDLPTLADDATTEPEPPDPVATCLGRSIRRYEVERYAAVPLYEARAALIATLCAQLDISYERPFVLEQVARSKGLTLDEMLAMIDGDLAEISDTDVEREALERFGSTDAVALMRARLAIDARRREARRRAWLEKVRRETDARCMLAMPPAPAVGVRTPGVSLDPQGGGVPIHYFGDFACKSCRAGWSQLTELRNRYAGRATAFYHAHFPELDFQGFKRAAEAWCAADARMLARYAEWRLAHPGAPFDPEDAGLDRGVFDRCTGDALVAVRILDDTAEALRLGFRGAVPSWVIGGQPLRGLTTRTELERAVTNTLAPADEERPAADAAGNTERP